MDQTNYTNKITIMQVTESIEYTRYRKLAKFFTFTCVVLILELALVLYLINTLDGLQNTFESSIILSVMFGVIFIMTVALIASFVVNMKTIERGVGVLPVYKVVFQDTYKSNWSAGVRFIVEIPDGSGATVKTREIFSPSKPANLTNKSRTLVPALYVDDFVGKEVLVMYNPKRNKIYILGIAENYSFPIDTF